MEIFADKLEEKMHYNGRKNRDQKCPEARSEQIGIKKADEKKPKLQRVRKKLFRVKKSQDKYRCQKKTDFFLLARVFFFFFFLEVGRLFYEMFLTDNRCFIYQFLGRTFSFPFFTFLSVIFFLLYRLRKFFCSFLQRQRQLRYIN